MSGQVSARACAGFRHFVVQAAHASLGTSEVRCVIVPCDQEPTQSDVVMFTIASYTFRALLFIHFNSDASTRACFAALANESVEEMAGDRFRDAVMERGNLICGSVNRELSTYFSHIGMSTPCVLSRTAAEHIDVVKPTIALRFCSDVGGATLHLTLVVCARGELDFAFEQHVEHGASAGDLEMF
jgi:CheY-specific phosphatase CheX